MLTRQRVPKEAFRGKHPLTVRQHAPVSLLPAYRQDRDPPILILPEPPVL